MLLANRSSKIPRTLSLVDFSSAPFAIALICANRSSAKIIQFFTSLVSVSMPIQRSPNNGLSDSNPDASFCKSFDLSQQQQVVANIARNLAVRMRLQLSSNLGFPEIPEQKKGLASLRSTACVKSLRSTVKTLGR